MNLLLIHVEDECPSLMIIDGKLFLPIPQPEKLYRFSSGRAHSEASKCWSKIGFALIRKIKDVYVYCVYVKQHARNQTQQQQSHENHTVHSVKNNNHTCWHDMACFKQINNEIF